MNDSQTQQNSFGSNLSQTQNPQTIPSQNLGAPSSNLQAPTGALLSQTGLKITSVGSSQFKPVNYQPTTGSSPALTADSSYSFAPLLVGSLIVLTVLTFLVILAIKKAKPQTSI